MLHLGAEAQRRSKLERVRRVMGRPGMPIGWVSTAQHRYRRRIRMRVDEAGHAAFFNMAKARDCLALTGSLVDAIAELRGRALPNVRHVEVRGRDLDGRAGLCLHPIEGAWARLPDLPRFVVGLPGGVAWQRWRVVGPVWSYVPVDAFLQVHEATNAALVRAVVEGASSRGVRTFADVYAGAGNHALALAHAGMHGTAVDRHPGAVHALRAAAREQRLPLVAESASAEACGLDTPDLVLANPPRAGLRSAASELAALAAPHVALVVCTAEALAADVAVFERHGYRLEELIAFDMFPGTDHLELLGWMSAPDAT